MVSSKSESPPTSQANQGPGYGTTGQMVIEVGRADLLVTTISSASRALSCTTTPHQMVPTATDKRICGSGWCLRRSRIESWSLEAMSGSYPASWDLSSTASGGNQHKPRKAANKTLGDYSSVGSQKLIVVYSAVRGPGLLFIRAARVVCMRKDTNCFVP